MDWPLDKNGNRLIRAQMRYGIVRMQTPPEMEAYINDPGTVPLVKLSDASLIAMYRRLKHRSVSRRHGA